MSSSRTPSTGSLRLALRLNAAFSSVSAALLLFASGPLGREMGVDPRLLMGVGVGLALFAVQLLVTAARRDEAKLRSEGLQHSIADLLWVAASIVVIAFDLLTPLGDALLAAVGLPVLALGIAQYRSLPPKRTGGRGLDSETARTQSA